MCGYQDALSNIMPMDWFDPYGRTPFANNAELSVDITIVETEDGIRAKSVKNPPRSGSNRLMEAIKNALGVGSLDTMASCEPEEKESKNFPEKKDNVENQQKPDFSGKKEDRKEEVEDDRDRQ